MTAISSRPQCVEYDIRFPSTCDNRYEAECWENTQPHANKRFMGFSVLVMNIFFKEIFSALLALYSQRFSHAEFWWHNAHRRSVWYIFEFNVETYQCCQWMQFVLCARSCHHGDQNRVGIRRTMITWGRCWAGLVLTCSCMFNSLTPMRCGSTFSATFKHVLQIEFMYTSWDVSQVSVAEYIWL